MTLDDFAETTRRIIARDGFDGYMPTAYFPDRRHIVVLEGVPEGADVERIALEWAVSKAFAKEEYLVAFKVDANRFKVMRKIGDVTEQAMFEVVQPM